MKPISGFVPIELIDGLAARGDLVLSVQCLSEFSAASLRRGVAVPEVETVVARWRDLGEVLALARSCCPCCPQRELPARS